MSSKAVKNLELVISNFIRNNYENKYDKQPVPMALKYLMTKFSLQIIPSTILTIQQDLKFYELLKTKLSNIKTFKLLFTASNHNYSAKQFHSFCDNQGPTLSIFLIDGNIFGGYTSKSWKSGKDVDVECVYDEDAFLFLIKSEQEQIQSKCPSIFSVDKDEEASSCCVHHDGYDESGINFGDDIWVWIDDNNNCTVTQQPEAYDYKGLEGYIFWNPSNGDSSRKVLEYEVFKIC